MLNQKSSDGYENDYFIKKPVKILPVGSGLSAGNLAGPCQISFLNSSVACCMAVLYAASERSSCRLYKIVAL